MGFYPDNIFVGKWMGLYPGGLKPGGGGLKWDFTVSALGFCFCIRLVWEK